MENASKALIIAGAILISILLISIGIILINSGKDITSTGVSGVNSQKIQAFNANFTSFEGRKKGSELKSLASIVRSSNASDKAHQVALFIGDATDSADQDVTSIAGLTGSKTYDVELVYNEGTAENYTQIKPNGGTDIIVPDLISEEGYVIAIIINDID